MRRRCFGLTLVILLALAATGCISPKSTTEPAPTAEENRRDDPSYQIYLNQQREEGIKEYQRQQETGSVGRPIGKGSGPYICTNDKSGVMLRDDAQCQHKTATGLSEGSLVEVTGEPSPGCRSVRTPGGATGYVPTEYLCSGQVSPPPTPSGVACNIKGNVQLDTGEKVYYVPGQKYYDDTVISPGYGERWFCSEAEAIAAGWRKSKE